MNRLFALLGPISAMLAVCAGAFGTHGLRARLDERLLNIFQTAVEYHFYHAIGLTLVALALQQRPQSRLLQWSGSMMFAGILLFSGSLYILALTDTRWLGMITPFGGLLFITSWILLALGLYQQEQP